jgi:hypothetical protein
LKRVKDKVRQGHIIEINGKRYDATTGAVLGISRNLPSRPTVDRRVIDGFVRAPKVTAAKPPKTVAAKPAPVAAPVVSTPKLDITPVRKKAHAPGQHVQPHQTERPKTLMRHAVKKPEKALKPAIKIQVPVAIAARPKHALSKLEKKVSVTQVNPARAARAGRVSKSERVGRFVAPATQQKQVAFTAPAELPAAVSRPQTYSLPRQNYADIRRPAAVAKAAPAVQEPEDIFERALARANSHEQRPPVVKRKHSKLVNAFAAAAAFLVIGGFVAYLNIPNIQIRMASMRAGIRAQVPSYKPVGYRMQNIESSKGHIAVSFVSGESSFRITQETSEWNSQTLLDNYVALSSKSYKTVENTGRTIYIYDGNHAAWVNAGIRYDITGNAALSQNDLVSMATSI